MNGGTEGKRQPASGYAPDDVMLSTRAFENRKKKNRNAAKAARRARRKNRAA